MQKFSSNYASCNNNYIIQINKEDKNSVQDSLYSTYNVLQNILQRGNPTKLSKYLLNKFENINVNVKMKLFDHLRM